MIHGVTSNKKTFRPIQFKPGVNLILADRSAKATDKDTTNALGKSTLIEILDFCLGSNLRPNDGLRAEALVDWAFTLEITVAAQTVRVTRSLQAPNFVEIEGATDAWPLQPKIHKETGTRGLDTKSWRAVLGWSLFGLPASHDDDDGYRPSARSLLSYFVRSHPAAYLDPFKHFANQKTWDIQLSNGFLLGLDWRRASEWQVLKDRKNALEALKNAVKTGAIQGELGSLGELEASRVQLETQLERERVALANFQVLPQYKQIEQTANRLTAGIHELVNANVTDRRRIERYNASSSAETGPQEEQVEAMYREAGITLSDAIARTLDEAREFNRKIVANRKRFVSDEISKLNSRCLQREAQIANLSAERAKHLSVLASHGALEELTKLQEQHASTRQALDAVKDRISRLRQISTRSDEIKSQTVELKGVATADYEERRPLWSKALALFAENSNSLYKMPGKLVIDIDETGYRFGVDIPGSPSEGISKMKIFCYDLMLIAFSRMRGLGIDFLVHDSTIFDGVDPRQRAHAIELAAAASEEHGFQYVLTMNTDMLPTEDFSDGFSVDELIRLRLTDTDASGSLLGIRY